MTSGGDERIQAHDKSTLVPRADAAVAPSAALTRAITSLPSLPDVAVERAVRLAGRLPERLRMYALQIVANKMASDFALRYLLLLDDTLTDAQAGELHLDAHAPRDEQLLTSLLEPWTHVPASVRVHSLDEFTRFASLTVGLQIQIEAAMPQGRESWLFDSGPQYHSMLVRTRLLPEAVLTAYTVHGADGMQQIKLQGLRYGTAPPAEPPSAWRWDRPGKRDSAPQVVEPKLITEAPMVNPWGSVTAVA